MKTPFAPLLLASLCLLALPATSALASIQGVYGGNYVTGTDGGAAFSYVHASTTAKKSGEAGYMQHAGGTVLFAIDNSANGVSFFFNDPNSNGLDDGDSLTLTNQKIALTTYDGSLNTTNTGAAAGFLTLNGTLDVGGTPSTPAGLTHGLRNITATDTSPSFSGLSYTITDVTDTNTLYSGEIFFQSGALAGPFNGIGYDASTKTITFALWGNSLNKGGTQTGLDAAGGDAPLGFDLYVTAELLPNPGGNELVPEAASFGVWGLLLATTALRSRRRRTKAVA